MSKKYCKVAPDKGLQQFLELKRLLGYERATKLWNDVVTHPEFLEDYKDTLTLDSEGIPTFDSIMNNPYIQTKIGLENIRSGLQNQFTTRENTRTNYRIALGEAVQFNQNNKNTDKFIAVVKETDNGVRVSIVDRTEQNLEQFRQQFGISTLNDRIADLLAPLGITIGTLQEAGIYGITDFSKAQAVADDIIKVADNLQGEYSISEEFAHLCIEVFKDHPLVQRTRNLISDDNTIREILGESYEAYFQRYKGDTSKLVDEALGTLLQKSLLNVNSAPKKTQSLLSRLATVIKNLFKRVNTNSLREAVVAGSTAMDSLASNILKGDLQLSKSRIRAITRTDALYNLESQTKQVIDILDKATDLEAKMGKITRNEDTSFISEMIEFKEDDADTALGLCRYLQHAIEELRSLNLLSDKALKSTDPRVKFGFFRKIDNYINMYAGTIKEVNQLLESSRDDDELNLLSRTFDVNGITPNTIRDLVSQANSLCEDLAAFYSVHGIPEFAKFLEPFLGDNITNPFANGEKVLSVEDLLKKAPSDISFMDYFFTAMGNTSNPLLQLFDQAAKKAKDTARMKTLNDSKKIQSAYNKAKAAGVTDFTFMYRYDVNGNRTDQYIGTEEELQRLSEAELEFYNTFMQIKDKLDSKVVDKRASTNHVIQIRKDHSFGALGLIARGEFQQAAEYMSNLVFEKSYDDQQGFGSRKTLVGFNGEEYMLVPKYYLQNIDDQNDVSDDPVSSLIAYAYMANNFAEIDNIVDALETGRTLLKKSAVTETRGKKKVKEIFSWNNINVETEAVKPWEGTNLAKKLDAFFNSQIYGRYLEDQGVLTIGGKEVNIQKLTSTILGASSHIQLGFNWLANSANVVNGLAITNIEVASQKFFKPASLAKADKIYTTLLKDYMAELSNPIKKSKLALIEEYFDTRQNAAESAKKRYDKRLLTKILGPNVAFIGQEIGDHWLYNRVAIAYLLEKPAYYKDANGNRIKSNFYEALDVEVDENGVGHLVLKKGWETPGIKGNIFTYCGRQIAAITQPLFGIYNQDDQVAAQRLAQGRLMLQYRKWIAPALSKRFQSARYNAALDTWTEGYYMTLLHQLIPIGKDLLRGKFQLVAHWNEIKDNPEVYQNCVRALTEVSQYLFVLACIKLIDLIWSDKKNRPWLAKFLDYQARRQKTELGVLVPHTTMMHEGFKILQTPAAGLTAADNALSLLDALVKPGQYFKEIQQGPYKGMTQVQKAIYINTPYIRNIKRATSDIDTAITYFNQ